MVFFNTAGENSIILLVLLCVGASKQQEASRCDRSQTVSFQTPCTSCAAAPSARCPPGYTPSPTPTAAPHTPTCGYVVKLGRTEVELSGCSRTCVKSVVQSECCPGHWGPLCLPCPSWSGKKCNFHGACLDGRQGNGTCLCDEGFSGFACHECQSPLAYGPNCDRVCECVKGVCSKGPDGTGECLCQPPYSGPRCNQVSDQCRNCSSYSYCGGAGQQAGCVCLPGHRKSATLNTCMSSCSARDCHPDADCSMVGSKVQCVCKAGYHGDGKICLPINPCSVNNGDCPLNSTVCVFKGPNKSSCECMLGMAPLGSSPKAGCVLGSACSLDTCDSTAFCETGLDGMPRCKCAAGQMGDGWRCYGNLMERVLELDQRGDQRGKLSGAIILFEGGCQLPLSQEGPFTAFIPRMAPPPSEEVQKEVCRRHLMLGQHLLEELEGRDVNFFGGETVRFKGNKRFILTEDPLSVYTVVQADLPAANGIIHIIDRPIGSPVPGVPHDQMFADQTIKQILSRDQKFNRFQSLVDNCGATLPLSGPGPLTVFIPTNKAVDDARDGSLMYMITDAKHKLQELLKYHMYSHAALSADELASLPQIQTMANQIITITLGNDGKVLLGEKSVPLVTTNIVASNGIVHIIEGLLVPPSIMPIMPHRCDVISARVSTGPCIHCNSLHATRCPDGTTELATHQTGCDYGVSSSVTLSNGCAKFCNSTTQVAECCSGFYGPDCKPCIGGFKTPCYDRGRCSDGIHGNGACSCHSAFTGVACHICSDPNKHGDHCDQDCLCVHGVCDNRPHTGGVCRPGCSEGFAGPLCDRTTAQCSADGLHRHCHVDAYCLRSGADTVCVCKDGFEGDGLSCSLVNPCLKNRGGCDANAQCVFVSEPNVSCVCNEGWSGDGLACVEINNCDLASRGGCSPDADCLDIGPAQSVCKCKSGFQGDGDTCVRIDPCRKNNGGCHNMAKCSLSGDQVNCTCPADLQGDGLSCYGSLLEELDSNRPLYWFNRWLQRDKTSADYLSQNVTVFAPSREIWKNFSSDQEMFWFKRHRITHFLQAHMLPGVWSVKDLKGLVGHSLPSLSAPTSWIISSSNGTLCVGNASILTADLPSTNGYIHIINGLLAPPLSDLSPDPPTLMGFLNSSSNFTLFRYYARLYTLEEGHDFTLLLPTDDAVRRHLSSTNSTLLDPSVFRYHFLNEALHPSDLRDGLLKETLLGEEYSLQFHRKNNQTLANDAVIDSVYVETMFGVVMVLNQVLKVQKNRCSQSVHLQVKGRCSSCDQPPKCAFNYLTTRAKFPDDMVPNCHFRKRVGSRRKSVPGCQARCYKIQKDHTCCPGYYGHECYRCPGEGDGGCSGHGRCEDGNIGNGECRCYEGFHGTACEDCEPGRFGTNCSSKCVCDHGKCEDGLAGSGRCLCFKGWRGTSCSVEIKDDVCGGICDENANCVTGPQGSSPTCVCAAGYLGNGTSCKELDLCGLQNGGCAAVAVCSQVSPYHRTCSCKDGYTGDGVVCLEVDGCLFNNGGCDRTAECTRTGPNTTACSCLPGFILVGYRCTKMMICSRSGKCVCSPISIRMGACKGNTLEELKHNPKNDFFRKFMNTYYRSTLTFKGPVTVFVPDMASNKDFPLSEWQAQGRTQHLSQAHVVSCESLSFSDLTTTKRAISLSGHPLDFTQRQGDVYINNRSRIIGSDVTTDGIIHYVDQVLTPYSLENKTALNQKMNFTSALKAYGYTRFSDLLKDTELLPVLSMTRHQPFRMLWPTDEALQQLPEARRTWLSAPEHKQQLQDILEAHILMSSMLFNEILLITESRTMHGSKISFNCNKDLAGDLTVNGARVVERFLVFREGVAFGIDQLLEPPGLGAHCDGLETRDIKSRCGSCTSLPVCPYHTTATGESELCSSYSRGFSTRRSGYTSLRLRPYSTSCRRFCKKEVWTPKCCPGHYGRDCQVCPGGLAAPCGNHGKCKEGMYSDGTCTCYQGFSGTACERCEPGYYGNNCTKCQCVHGSCDHGVDGTGECSCETGWYGKLCKEKLDQIPVECDHCHEEAACVPGSGCQCRNHFEGNGTHCSPMPVPDLCAEYNGGCHQHADCNQTSWQTNCSCQAGYHGDGYSCEPINRCIEQLNGGCSDFATCKFTGPGQRQCECKPGYVGNGVQCLERVVPPVDRCLEENGGCHAQASCKDLHYHARTAGVFYLPSPQSVRYQMNLTEAQNGCSQQGATLASFKQLADAQQLGMHLCIAGWLEGGKVGYPTTVASPRCGDGHVGVVLYKEPVSPSSKYDAYCYRETDVSCVCKNGYVGDGGFCNGAVINVLAMNTDYSLFYKLILGYSGSSVKGRELLDFLSSGGSDVMLFVPHNDGFLTNQTLSGRDLEYHVSANHSRRLYQDLRHQEEVRTWLGANLIVTHGNNQSDKLVNHQLLLDWDVPATNGIIHVIQAPLRAPPLQAKAATSLSPAPSSGVSAILVTLLLCGLGAGAVGYFLWRRQKTPYNFQYFKNETEAVPAAMMSIDNPLYSENTDSGKASDLVESFILGGAETAVEPVETRRNQK